MVIESGLGPPMQVSYKGEVRALHDGAGLCSPGRWPVSKLAVKGRLQL